jgi:hypothetical protein
MSFVTGDHHWPLKYRSHSGMARPHWHTCSVQDAAAVKKSQGLPIFTEEWWISLLSQPLPWMPWHLRRLNGYGMMRTNKFLLSLRDAWLRHPSLSMHHIPLHDSLWRRTLHSKRLELYCQCPLPGLRQVIAYPYTLHSSFSHLTSCAHHML